MYTMVLVAVVVVCLGLHIELAFVETTVARPNMDDSIQSRSQMFHPYIVLFYLLWIYPTVYPT